jgi:dCTP deaminase
MTGVLADSQLTQMIARGEIAARPAVTPEQIQPASLDLRLGHVAYRVRASFLAGHGRTVVDRLEEFEMHRVDLNDGAVLEKGCVYVVPLMERLALPAGVQAVANAKSSTGRLDLLTRTICDGGTEFDRIVPGYNGPLYAEICPRSFSVLVRPGMRLNQIRFRQGQAVLSDAMLGTLHAEMPLVDGEAVIDDGLGFSVDLRLPGSTLVGYRAKPHTGVIDLDRIGHYDPTAFWEDVHSKDVPFTFWSAERRFISRLTMPPKWPPTSQWLGNSASTTQGFSTPALVTTQPVVPDRAGCSKCAATRHRLFWNTGRSWAA